LVAVSRASTAGRRRRRRRIDDGAGKDDSLRVMSFKYYARVKKHREK